REVTGVFEIQTTPETGNRSASAGVTQASAIKEGAFPESRAHQESLYLLRTVLLESTFPPSLRASY
ncbi:hypothetical protein, partial [Shewanella indica]|uniref:hypothetical protein n=1 Tax=Shewanella indica TaxID=768528 RepID=UPI00399A8C3E